MQRVLAVLFVLALEVHAFAQAPQVDWSRGLIIARGAAHGRLTAPSPELARIDAGRRALALAKTQLRTKAFSLTKSNRKALSKSEKPKFKGKLHALIDRAFPVGEEHHSDGSVEIELAVGLDELRTLIYGFDAPKKGSPAFVGVRVEGDASLKSVGISIEAADISYRPPMLWFKSEAAASGAGYKLDERVSGTPKGRGVIALSGDASDQLRLWKEHGTVILLLGE